MATQPSTDCRASRSVDKSQARLRVLHLVLTVGETSSSYHQIAVPLGFKHDVTVCTYFRSTITSGGSIRVVEGDGTAIRFIRTLNAVLRENDFDIVHVHSPHTALLLKIASVFSGTNATKVYTVHSSYDNYKLRNKLMLLLTFAFFDRLVFCSDASAVSFPRVFSWMIRTKKSVVRNGVDLERVDRAISTVGGGFGVSPQKRFDIISVGRLIESKNAFTALNAFIEADDGSSTFSFLGEGPLEPRLTEQIQLHEIDDRVHLQGLVARDQVYQHLARADLFVSTSRAEGLPVAVLEAMACGCPVVLSDIPPHREITRGVDFVPLVSPDDYSGFAREIQSLRAMSQTDRATIGRKCRELVEKRFNLWSMLEGYESVYFDGLK